MGRSEGERGREALLLQGYCIHCIHSTFLSLFQATMATIMVSVGDISELIEAFSAAAFVFYMLVFISVLIMRVTHRDQPRLFKVHFTLYSHCNNIIP